KSRCSYNVSDRIATLDARRASESDATADSTVPLAPLESHVDLEAGALHLVFQLQEAELRGRTRIDLGAQESVVVVRIQYVGCLDGGRSRNVGRRRCIRIEPVDTHLTPKVRQLAQADTPALR